MTTIAIRPFVPLVLAWRHRRGLEDRLRIKERSGVASLPRPEGRLVWVHAASTGDAQTLLPLIDRLGARGFHVLLSTRTLASATALKRMLPAGSFHQFMPLDVPVYVRRFLDHWRPDMVLLAGAEIWPNLLIETGRRSLPILFVNARMSDRVYAKCRRLRRFVAALLGRVDLCLARTDRDAERFVDLGAVSVQTVGDLVFDGPLPGADPQAVSAFASRVGARPIWVAAQTERDEIGLILEVHRQLLPRYPTLVTVVLPRLPGDGAAMAAAALAQHLDVGLRSQEPLPKRLQGVFVADVAGEVGLFYRAGDIAFVGRFADRRRPQPDRGGEARLRHPARAAYRGFRGNLRRAGSGPGRRRRQGCRDARPRSRASFRGRGKASVDANATPPRPWTVSAAARPALCGRSNRMSCRCLSGVDRRDSRCAHLTGSLEKP